MDWTIVHVLIWWGKPDQIRGLGLVSSIHKLGFLTLSFLTLLEFLHRSFAFPLQPFFPLAGYHIHRHCGTLPRPPLIVRYQTGRLCGLPRGADNDMTEA